MIWRRKKITKEVMGWQLEPPRLTFGAYIVMAKYLALPIFAGLALLDVIFYVIIQHGFGYCYGILCLFQ